MLIVVCVSLLIIKKFTITFDYEQFNISLKDWFKSYKKQFWNLERFLAQPKDTLERW